jgi:hypothetical protein
MLRDRLWRSVQIVHHLHHAFNFSTLGIEPTLEGSPGRDLAAAEESLLRSHSQHPQLVNCQTHLGLRR